MRPTLSKEFLCGMSLALAGLLVVSGATGVAYEVLWSRDFALLFGATAVGAAVVLAATFGGLALGAWLGGKTVHRLRERASPGVAGSRVGLQAYGFLELTIALAIGAYLLLRPVLPPIALALTQGGAGPLRPLLQTALAAAVLLIPSALLGATLPAAAAALAPDDRVGAARFYAWNSLGGAAGALGAVALALPALGVVGTYVACMALDVAVGAVALLVATRIGSRSSSVEVGSAGPPPRREES